MSYQLMTWASEQTTGSSTRKAVLLALANAANHHTGRCFPSVARLCTETEASEKTVRRALDELEAAGFISRERRRRDDGTLSTYEYEFPPVRMTASPLVTETSSPAVTVTARNQEGPNQEGSSTANAVDSLAREPGIYDGDKRWAVNRKTVSISEGRLAADVMRTWNELTSQSLRSKDWLAKVIMRIREYPEATLEDHRYLIERNLANPWWTGPPTPSVIYGSGAQFERSVMTARHQEDDSDRIKRIVEAVERRSA